MIRASSTGAVKVYSLFIGIDCRQGESAFVRLSDTVHPPLGLQSVVSVPAFSLFFAVSVGLVGYKSAFGVRGRGSNRGNEP